MMKGGKSKSNNLKLKQEILIYILMQKVAMERSIRRRSSLLEKIVLLISPRVSMRLTEPIYALTKAIILQKSEIKIELICKLLFCDTVSMDIFVWKMKV